MIEHNETMTLLEKVKVDTDSLAELVVDQLLTGKNPYFHITMEEDVCYFVFKDRDSGKPRVKWWLNMVMQQLLKDPTFEEKLAAILGDIE